MGVREILLILVVLLGVVAVLLIFPAKPAPSGVPSNALVLENSRLREENDSLQSKIGGLEGKLRNVEADCAELQKNYDSEQRRCAAAVQPPYVVWSARKATAVFKDLNGTLHEWEWDANVLESAMQEGWYRRHVLPEMIIPFLSDADSEYAKKLKAEAVGYVEIKMKDGRNVRAVDVRPFVTPAVFGSLIGEIAGSGKSDEQVVKEVWNISRQLTTYSAELTETPRYPAETLSLGGGDCEDTVILAASLLKAVPRNWKVQVVYMDFDNPAEPKEINHMAVYVDTGSYSAIIETTDKKEMNPFGADVNGWYFDV